MSSSKEDTKKLSPPTRGVQGPKPPTLKVGKNSSKIKKQHVVGPDHHRPPPVIIYLKSPEVLHVEARDFMNTVQRLTGCSSPSLPSSALPCIRGSVGCNSKIKVDEKIEGELEPERNVEVDDTFLVCDEMCFSGPPFGPLPTPSSVSFFPSPNAYPDFCGFDKISDAPDYQDPSFERKI